MRAVYPGFLQLSGFMQMNLDRHVDAHKELFLHLVEGDGDSAGKHRDFYDEYLAVMDLDAAYYLQTVDTVFVRHALPKGEMRHRGALIETGKIKRVALMTVEGEKDDISGIGQTAAAHDICPSIPEARRVHYEQPGVGHYGVFNGSRFRSEIAPRISDFVAGNQRGKKIRRAIRSVKSAASEKMPAQGKVAGSERRTAPGKKKGAGKKPAKSATAT
jgi:poly(3-hydroxybutyrate) depolymerase